VFVYVEVIGVQAYVKMYQGDELPEPKSMLQASQIFSVILVLFPQVGLSWPYSVNRLTLNTGNATPMVSEDTASPA